jgi:hypothetical protein
MAFTLRRLNVPTVHVVEPDKFPLDAAAQYKPKAHTLEQAHEFLGQLGINKMVIVGNIVVGVSLQSHTHTVSVDRCNQVFTVTTMRVHSTV